MVKVGDLVQVNFQIADTEHTMIGIITSVDERNAAYHVKSKEAGEFGFIVANSAMLAVIQEGFVTNDRKRFARLDPSARRKIIQKRGFWWI